MQINPAKTAHTANAIRAVISITYHEAIIASISFSLSVGYIINYIAYCSRCTIPEVIGKTASAAANYFVSKGYYLSEASLAFAEIIPLEKRQVFPFRRENVPDAGGKLCTQLVFTAIVYIVSIVYTKYTKNRSYSKYHTSGHINHLSWSHNSLNLLRCINP